MTMFEPAFRKLFRQLYAIQNVPEGQDFLHDLVRSFVIEGHRCSISSNHLLNRHRGRWLLVDLNVVTPTSSEGDSDSELSNRKES